MFFTMAFFSSFAYRAAAICSAPLLFRLASRSLFRAGHGCRVIQSCLWIFQHPFQFLGQFRRLGPVGETVIDRACEDQGMLCNDAFFLSFGSTIALGTHSANGEKEGTASEEE